MGSTHENNPITRPLSLQTPVKSILQTVHENWSALHAWNFFSHYYGNPYGMHRHPSVTMEQFLKNPELYIPDSATRNHIQLGLKPRRALMQKHLERDLDKLLAANIISLEEWQTNGESL